MPLARYFLYVGGVLLTLLFIFDAYLTEVPVAQRGYPNVPVIRIHSDRKWPDRVVFDTSLPTPPAPPRQTAIVEERVPSSPTVADVAVNERERQAFALVQPSAPGKRAVTQQRQRRIAKRHVIPRSMLAARQPHFGWFGNTFW
jgi:proline-rich tail region repeat protein